MHCPICDADSDSLVFVDHKPDSCSHCQSAIQDCLDGYPKIADDLDLDQHDPIDAEFDEASVDYFVSVKIVPDDEHPY